MIASNLIQMARSRLGDEVKHRWTDTRLLTILDQGQKDFCKLSGIYRKTTVIPLSENTRLYALPEDSITVNRLEYKGALVPLFSRNDIDEGRVLNTEFVGIKDNLVDRIIELYPTLPMIEDQADIRQGIQSEDTFEFNTLYGVITSIDAPYEVVDVYGEVINTTYEVDDLEDNKGFGEVVDTSYITQEIDNIDQFGVVVTASLLDADVLHGFITSSEVYEVIGKFGVTSSIVTEAGYMKIFYTAMPPTLYLPLQALILHDTWEAAMLRYIVGTALQDDNDSSNIERGELELKKYIAEVLKARELTTKDFSRGQKDKLKTRFRRV